MMCQWLQILWMPHKLYLRQHKDFIKLIGVFRKGILFLDLVKMATIFLLLSTSIILLNPLKTVGESKKML